MSFFDIVQVVSVQFDPHYLDADNHVAVEKYGETAMNFIKTSPGIFGQPSTAVTKVSFLTIHNHLAHSAVGSSPSDQIWHHQRMHICLDYP